jgi:hypothetical protein
MKRGSIALVLLGVVYFIEFFITNEIVSSITTLRNGNPFTDLELYRDALTIIAFLKGGLFIFAGISFYNQEILTQTEKYIEVSKNDSMGFKTENDNTNNDSIEALGFTNLELSNLNIVTSERGRRLVVKPIDIEKLTYLDAIKNVKLINETEGVTWRLPDIDDLYLIFNKRSNISSTFNGAYWSSTEFEAGKGVWCYDFDNGESRIFSKDSYCYILLVRSV